MFLRPCYRTKNGKRHAYWALVESYRAARGPRQRVVAYLGQADARSRRRTKAAAGQPDEPGLFEPAEPPYAEVDLRTVRVERCLEFGGPWLGLQLLKKLELLDFLQEIMPFGREEVPWPLMAAVLVLCRLCKPSSELHIAEHLYKRTALADLLGVPASKINDDRLYRGLDRVLFHKEALQVFLKNRLGSLFDLKYDLLLYDVTSTYFEARPTPTRRPSVATAGTAGRTASRCVSRWWSPATASRWATRPSPATARTSRRWRRSSRRWRSVTGGRSGSGRWTGA